MLRKAKLTDIVKMQELVAEEVEKGVILFRSNDEMATNIRSYTLAFEDDKLLGFGALHFHAIDLAEVRSVIVDKSVRGKGVGKKIINALIEEAREYSLPSIFTLTYQKSFFESLGFEEIPKESLPAHKIWADCIKCKYFPVCEEIALIKHL